MHDDLLIQRPAQPDRLWLFFHGVGASAEDLRPLAQAMAARQPQAFVVSVRAPDASDLGRGWQWFSVQGVTEANRPARVAAAMPLFQQAIHRWQRESGVGPDATTLVGFSQGAIMALEATQRDAPAFGRVIALAGRFAQSPRVAPPGLTLHMLHGEQDGVMPVTLAADATARWAALGGHATLDRYTGLGHGIDDRIVQRTAECLET